MSDNEHGGATMPDLGLAYPSDKMRGPDPTAPAWAVVRGFTPGSHYVLTESWADLDGRYAVSEIVARGLTYDDAEERVRLLNNPNGCRCEGCVRRVVMDH